MADQKLTYEDFKTLPFGARVRLIDKEGVFLGFYCDAVEIHWKDHATYRYPKEWFNGPAHIRLIPSPESIQLAKAVELLQNVVNGIPMYQEVIDSIRAFLEEVKGGENE